jgi:7-cyano-7-deazaguanine synthase
MQKKAFVLLSGGLDSTTCLHIAIFDGLPKDPGMEFSYGDPDILAETLRKGNEDNDAIVVIPWVEAVSINFGQRHKRELEFASKTCARLGIKHTILDVGNLLSGKEILLSAESIGEKEMVHMSYDDIKGVSPSYVPFRNGLMLSALTAHAQKWVNSQIQQCVDEGWTQEAATHQAKDLATIYYGAHAEDAANWAYPDCTPEFNGSMANAIYTGSYNTIRLATPLQWSKKHEIVSKGDNLGVRFNDTWSCYDNGKVHCGKCPTCLARKEAFRCAEVDDPTVYDEGKYADEDIYGV